MQPWANEWSPGLLSGDVVIHLTSSGNATARDSGDLHQELGDDSFRIFANKVEIADEEHGDAATPNKV